MLSEIEKFDQAHAEQVDDVWYHLLSTEGGRLVLHTILEKCGMKDFDHYGNEFDAVRKGQQQVGAMILEDHVYKFGMSFYTQMILENEAREKARKIAMELSNEEEEQ